MPTLLILLKWLAQVLIFASGLWALLGAESIRADPSTGRKRLTPSGWARVALLAIGVILFAASDYQERQAARARARLAELEAQQQREVIEALREQLDYTRELYLLQFELTRLRVAFEVGAEDRQALAAALAPSDDEERADEDLKYFANGNLSVRRAIGERWEVEYHLPRRGLDGVYAQDSLAWNKLERALRDLVGCRLELASGELLVDLLGRHWPCEFDYDGSQLAFVIEKPGIALWHLRDAQLFVECPPSRKRMPARLVLRAEDLKLELASEFDLVWRVEELYSYVDADSNDQTVTQLVAGPHPLNARVRERAQTPDAR